MVVHSFLIIRRNGPAMFSHNLEDNVFWIIIIMMMIKLSDLQWKMNQESYVFQSMSDWPVGRGC